MDAEDRPPVHAVAGHSPRVHLFPDDGYELVDRLFGPRPQGDGPAAVGLPLRHDDQAITMALDADRAAGRDRPSGHVRQAPILPAVLCQTLRVPTAFPCG